jgi:hypothetical protein
VLRACLAGGLVLVPQKVSLVPRCATCSVSNVAWVSIVSYGKAFLKVFLRGLLTLEVSELPNSIDTGRVQLISLLLR